MLKDYKLIPKLILCFIAIQFVPVQGRSYCWELEVLCHWWNIFFKTLFVSPHAWYSRWFMSLPPCLPNRVSPEILYIRLTPPTIHLSFHLIPYSFWLISLSLSPLSPGPFEWDSPVTSTPHPPSPLLLHLHSLPLPFSRHPSLPPSTEVWNVGVHSRLNEVNIPGIQSPESGPSGPTLTKNKRLFVWRGEPRRN